MLCQFLDLGLEEESGNFHFLSLGAFPLGALSCHAGEATGRHSGGQSQLSPSFQPSLLRYEIKKIGRAHV